MSAPPITESLARATENDGRKKHFVCTDYEGDEGGGKTTAYHYCHECELDWPCPTAILVWQIDRLRAKCGEWS